MSATACFQKLPLFVLEFGLDLVRKAEPRLSNLVERLPPMAPLGLGSGSGSLPLYLENTFRVQCALHGMHGKMQN